FWRQERRRSYLSATVDHLRWDLHQIFSLAAEEGHIGKNPGRLLVTPEHVRTSTKKVMTIQQVKQRFSSLPVRDRLIVKLGVLGGMRPGEILALQWKHVGEGDITVRQR